MKRTFYLVYKSIGNPAYNTDVCLCTTRREAREVATKKNDGKWWGKHSQASPFFIRPVKLRTP